MHHIFSLPKQFIVRYAKQISDLLLRLFIPEVDKDIRELIYFKKQPVIINHIINILVAITIMILIGMMFLAYLKNVFIRNDER